ncbi:MAG: CvpA family protein [Alphaproteobacteria bacterium]|nr:CvpA family protein [Alphaproteobacteria bacterium]
METTHFNVFDLIGALVLVSSGVFAFRRGLVREIMALGTWVLASLFAFSFYPLARPFLEQQIKNQMLADAATAVGLFCIAIIVLVPLGDYLTGLVKTPTLSSIDRSLGFVFGLLRGFIIMCLLYLGTTFIWPADQNAQPKWLSEAKTQSALAYGVNLLKSIVPETTEGTEEMLNKSREEAQQSVDDVKRLEDISTPVPTYTKKNVPVSSYGTDSRSNMDNLVDRNNE